MQRPQPPPAFAVPRADERADGPLAPLRPSAQTFNAVISAYEQAGKPEGAFVDAARARARASACARETRPAPRVKRASRG